MHTILQNSARAHRDGALAGARDATLAEGVIPETDLPGYVESADRLPLARARGQSLFEYSVIILFLILAVFLSLLLIAPALNSIFNQVPGLF